MLWVCANVGSMIHELQSRPGRSRAGAVRWNSTVVGSGDVTEPMNLRSGAPVVPL